MAFEKVRVCTGRVFVYIILPFLSLYVVAEGLNTATALPRQVGRNKHPNSVNISHPDMNTHTGSLGGPDSKNSSAGVSQSSSRTTVAGVLVTEAEPRPMSIQRALYVLVAVSALVIVYFVIRTVRMKKNRKTRRYGVLDTNLAMEMTPLEQEEDEEDDTTLFDARQSRR